LNTVHISIRAYNAEKTLRRAVDSVLAQTYKNFKLYLCDNGSTDSTREIVREYAAKGDAIPFFNDENYVWTEETKAFSELCENIPQGDFYALLDADDELFPDYFEKLVDFSVSNDLDIAAANFEMENAETGENALGVPNLSADMIFDTPEKYDQYYRNYLLAFRAYWGKIYRPETAKMLKEFKTPVSPRISDVFNVLAALLASKKAGVLKEPLMRYYVSRKSVINSYHDTRKDFPEAIFNALGNFISEKAGRMSSENLTYIYKYYCGEFREVLRIHLWIDIPEHTKLDETDHLFSSEVCRELYRQADYFEIFKNNNTAFDLLEEPLEWIFENRKTLPPGRVIKLYYKFFDIVYQNKPGIFTKEEIKRLLGVSIPLTNCLLCGVFENAVEALKKLPDSEMKKSVQKKINQNLQTKAE
jgi:glycosyltransferase involved in cell wall biosynthesis